MRYRTVLFALLVAALLALGAHCVSAQAPAAGPAPAQAQPSQDRSFLDEETKGADAEIPSMGATLAKLVGVMLLLFALLVGGLAIFQKVARRGLRIGGSQRPLSLVDKLSLGPKSSICLVRACGRHLVVAVSDKEMSVLMELGTDEDGGPKNFAGTLEGMSAQSDGHVKTN